MNEIKTTNESLSETFDIDVIEDYPLEVIQDDVEDITGNVNTVDEETEYARNNIKNLIKTGNAALTQLSSLAVAMQHPRPYEVMAMMLKNISELNKDLLELQKRKNDLKPKDSKCSPNINVDKAVVFTGSTSELIKLIKQSKD